MGANQLLGGMNDSYGPYSAVPGQLQEQHGPPNCDQIISIDQNVSPFGSTFDNTDFTSNLDWFLEDAGANNFLATPDFFGLFGFNENQSLHDPLMSAQQTAVPSARQSDAGGDDYVAMGDTREGDTSDSAPALGGLLTPRPQETGTSDNPWPVENPRPSQSHTILPGLGPEDQTPKSFSKFYSLVPVNDRTRQALVKCIMFPFEHSSTQTLNLDHFPNNETLDHCIDLYFEYFHPMLDVVHRPTFDPGRDLVVTLAMICIGSCYTGQPGAKSFSIALSELIRKLLVFMAEQDRRFVRTASYLTAQLLQGTHGYCSGSERLFEISESCRSTLVHHAKCMGLFRYESQHVLRPGNSQEEAWREWVREEGLRRLGWAVYKYDASVAYLHNNRPFLSIGDINLSLPSSTEHWSAESAQAWSSLHPWSTTCPPTSRLRPMIRLLFDGTTNPVEKIEDEEHCFVILLTLLRMLWTLKEIRSSPINDLVTPPIYDDGRLSLIHAIDKFAVAIVAASKNHTRSEINRLVHRMQLVHISHIYGAGDLMNWLYPYLRHGPEAENARTRMKQWANENAQRIRDVVFHCAQILALVRRYPSNMSLEPFLTFHAGVVLSCMALLLPTAVPLPQSPPILVDLLDSENREVTNRQSTWISQGGNERISLHGVPDLACALGRQQVLDQTALLLKRQRAWGMAANLSKVVLSLGARDMNDNTQAAVDSPQLLLASPSPPGIPLGLEAD
ncbi:hypothetical protein PV08_09970 [Exophiala spinifera]|uniref:Xylanolytic transcriptional activator regulatory domain-containing protein n=1 Tax=Exophiala spinifera TaxID=91928 RepID=A0A0D1ZIK7_9EURO|nr:uncharacterized protein PV08_09970 [Exophiala spinifera]KIW12692.1 hypothetical protein PV08_09970 [Exophiala spinifera]